MVKVTNLAHYIVDKCTRENKPVSNLQLQKMLYFIQTIYYRTRKKLLFETQFEAWPYGPVISDVYEEYSLYGGRVIEKYYSDEEKFLKGLSSEDRGFIDEGIENLRNKYPWDLVKISHAPNSPWAEIYKDGFGYKAPIPNQLIMDYAS